MFLLKELADDPRYELLLDLHLRARRGGFLQEVLHPVVDPHGNEETIMEHFSQKKLIV